MNRDRKNREPVTAGSVLIPLGAGVLIGILVLIFRGGLPADREMAWRNLCDALAVPGMILTCVGLLRMVSDQGAFDGIAFPVRKAFGQILSEKRRSQMPKTYYDYVSARQDKRGQKPRTTLWVGLGFLVLGLAALLVYGV